MMKKVIALFLVLTMVSTLYVPLCASAAEPQEQAEKVRTLEDLAYLDINTASQKEQIEILAARNVLAYTKEWVADGNIGWVEDVATGEIIRYLPSYSEVFPGWDLPTCNTYTKIANNYTIEDSITQSAVLSNDWNYLNSYDTFLEAASSTDATPFVYVQNSSLWCNKLKCYATRLTSSRTCNIGFADFYAMQSIGYGMNLTLNEAVVVSTFGRQGVTVRASTYDEPGWATMALEAIYQ